MIKYFMNVMQTPIEVVFHGGWWDEDLSLLAIDAVPTDERLPTFQSFALTSSSRVISS